MKEVDGQCYALNHGNNLINFHLGRIIWTGELMMQESDDARGEIMMNFWS